MSRFLAISHAELVDAIRAAKRDPRDTAFHAFWRGLAGMQFGSGAFSNEDCAGLEGSLPRWKAFRLQASCRYLSGVDAYLAAMQAALERRAQGALS